MLVILPFVRLNFCTVLTILDFFGFRISRRTVPSGGSEVLTDCDQSLSIIEIGEILSSRVVSHQVWKLFIESIDRFGACFQNDACVLIIAREVQPLIIAFFDDLQHRLPCSIAVDDLLLSIWVRQR
ncbi:hypothetical protein KOR42_54300 [Thalassoglobus neptunius]|uniref:Uncharacterized protein n=1 Tax=Thalassoglobus neptunius TaxID=1938619 RepID=A0A5C5UWJ5_9PLAN|nr:hypothetical protein KOR42_54300 [Thalassoglobus neptunius]